MHKKKEGTSVLQNIDFIEEGLSTPAGSAREGGHVPLMLFTPTTPCDHEKTDSQLVNILLIN